MDFTGTGPDSRGARNAPAHLLELPYRGNLPPRAPGTRHGPATALNAQVPPTLQRHFLAGLRLACALNRYPGFALFAPPCPTWERNTNRTGERPSAQCFPLGAVRLECAVLSAGSLYRSKNARLAAQNIPATNWLASSTLREQPRRGVSLAHGLHSEAKKLEGMKPWVT